MSEQITIEAVEGVMSNGNAPPEQADMREWIAGYPIHPVASMLPLVEGEDLERMVESIRQHGLKIPIVLNSQGEVVDGRNRLVCCEIAGVPPVFTYDESDPLDAVEDLNVDRRHLNRSQRAMLAAYFRHLRKQRRRDGPKQKGKNSDIRVFETVEETAKAHHVTEDLIYRASTVIQYAEELVPEVIAGRMTIAEAYDEARVIKDSKSRRAEMEAALQEKAPDLWQLVTDDAMKLPDAMRSLEARQREEYAHAVSLHRNMSTGFRLLDPGNFSIEEQAEHWLSVRPELMSADDDFSAERARHIARALLCYAERKESKDEAE